MPGGRCIQDSECRVEALDEDLTDIPSDPLVKDLNEEAPPLCSVDRALAHRSEVFDTGHVLDNWDELNETRPAVVSQEPVDRTGVLRVDGVDCAQDVVIDVLRAKKLETAQDAPASVGHACRLGDCHGARLNRRY